MDSRRFRAAAGVSVVELGPDELVARSPDQTRAVVLNPTASAVLDLCDGTRSVSEIAAFLAGELAGTSPTGAEADVSALVAELMAADILEELEP